MEIVVQTEVELAEFGARLGSLLKGGECLELVGDVGAGKTTLTKAMARGMGIASDITSPSYTLSQTYSSPSGLKLVHYDFYRLDTPGILEEALTEVLDEVNTVVAIEWAGIVRGVLPEDHLRIEIVPTAETSRRLLLSAGGQNSQQLLERLR